MKYALLGITLFAMGCGFENGAVQSLGQGDSPTLVARHGAVIADGCTLDGWQRDVLSSPNAKKVVREVILLCGTPREDGHIGPEDAGARDRLTAIVKGLQTDGYKVRLGVSFTDETGTIYDGTLTAKHLADPLWIATAVDSIVAFGALADGVELDLQRVPATSRTAVTSFVALLAPKLRPARTLGVFLPPSVSEPSDLPDGEAFDVTALAASTDRLRVMALDYSDQAGPTTDPGWAVDAARLAAKHAGAVPVDVAYPLYGTDFSAHGTRSISFTEAMGFAYVYHATIQRGPTLAPHVDWKDTLGVAHATWFDDATSTLAALRAWDAATLDPNVGVVFYGFGAEDPAHWNTLAGALP